MICGGDNELEFVWAGLASDTFSRSGSTVEPLGALQDAPYQRQVILARIGRLEVVHKALHRGSNFLKPLPGSIQHIPQVWWERVLTIELGGYLSHDQFYRPQPSVLLFDTFDQAHKKGGGDISETETDEHYGKMLSGMNRRR